MNVNVASFLIRCQIALVEEGIGPRNGIPEDREVLADAVRVAGHLFDEHELWNYEVIPDEAHDRLNCKAAYCRSLYEAF